MWSTKPKFEIFRAYWHQAEYLFTSEMDVGKDRTGPKPPKSEPDREDRMSGPDRARRT